jgi:hypothetical protein
MISRRQARATVFGLATLIVACGQAHATCNVNAAGMSMTPGTASTGTYTAPTVPTAQAIAVTITGTYTTNNTGGTCTLALSFQRATYPPATMANTSGGAATLPYLIQSASGSGNTILFTGASVSLSNVVQYTFASAGINLTNRAFTANFNIYASMQPAAAQAAGSYSDSLTAYVFNIASGASVFSRAFTVTGTVSKACTIGGVARPGADSATIPVSSTGGVNTAIINKSYASVACNTPSNVQLTSQNGGVKTVATPPSGFTNVIDYTSTATFSGATATLDTAALPAATAPEAGVAVSTTGATPSGTMSVAITPRANTLRLLSGTYSDVLTITITPQ